MRQFVALFAVVAALGGLAMPVSAALKPEMKEIRKEIQEKQKEFRREAKEKTQQAREELKTKEKELTEELKAKQAELKKKASEVKQFVRRTVTVTGELKEVKGAAVPTELMVMADRVLPKKNEKWTGAYPAAGQVVTVKVDEKSRIVRRYGGKSSLAEFTVGDKLNVVGKINEDGSVTAQVVKDESIHQTLRVHNGTIESLDAAGSSFVLKQEKQSLTIKTDAKTLIWVGGAKAAFSDLKVGDKTHVRGIINNKTKIITATLVRATHP